MVKHESILPECQEVHDNMKFMFITTCGFFLAYLFIATPMVIANVNDLKKEDQQIRTERSELIKARDQQMAETTQRINDGFLDLKVQLARIQVSIEKARK